jgi:DNA-binding transcriptional LysR family regulator
MEPRRVLTFRAVAHERSFTRAAQTLALSQPSVSQQVAALERELGTTLLDRRPGGLRLTPAGEVLLVHADAISERLDLARAQLTELTSAERVRLRLGAFPSALAGLVPDALARLQDGRPGIEVTVDEAPSIEMADRVASGDLHLALAFQDADAPRREPPGLDRIDLTRESFLVALPPGHRLAGRTSVRLAELADDAWTMPSADGILMRACQAAGFRPRITSITREQSAIRAMVMRGLAVTLAPQLLTDAFDGVVLVALSGDDLPRRDVFALLPPGGRHPLAGPALDALRDSLDRICGEPTT